MAKGSIRRDGATWSVVVDVGRVQGKRKQMKKRGFRTKGDAQRWLTEQLGRLDRGEYVAPSRQSFGEYLDGWLPTRRHKLRQSTYESYERNIRRHIIPKLGHISLQQLGPEHLERAYTDWQDGGRLDGRGGLSPRSVAYLHVIIHRALKDATRLGRVTRNVADIAEPPSSRGNRRDLTTWTAEQVAAFLDQLQGDALYVPVLLGATTGMRRGEVLGLRWQDVDLDQGRLQVRQTLSAPRNVDTGQHVPIFGEPKTAKGRRSIDLLPPVVAALRAHKKAQNELRLMGAKNPHGLVFVDDEHGQPIHPDRFRRRFEIRVARSGLPMIRFHDLRHTVASLLLAAGEHPKVVQELLGHAQVGITLDTYSHVAPGMQRAAVERLGSALFRPVTNR